VRREEFCACDPLGNRFEFSHPFCGQWLIRPVIQNSRHFAPILEHTPPDRQIQMRLKTRLSIEAIKTKTRIDRLIALNRHLVCGNLAFEFATLLIHRPIAGKLLSTWPKCGAVAGKSFIYEDRRHTDHNTQHRSVRICPDRIGHGTLVWQSPTTGNNCSY